MSKLQNTLIIIGGFAWLILCVVFPPTLSITMVCGMIFTAYTLFIRKSTPEELEFEKKLDMGYKNGM